MTFINKFKYIAESSVIFQKYSLYLNEVRKNLAAPGKPLLRCSTTYIPVGDLDRSSLILEPLSKSYGDHWLSARFGIEARLCRHAVACQEVATLSPNRTESPAGRSLKHASAALQPSPRTKGHYLRATPRSYMLQGSQRPHRTCSEVPLLRLCISGRSINLDCHISPKLCSLHAICGLARILHRGRNI
jgi:hypothetical protein